VPTPSGRCFSPGPAAPAFCRRYFRHNPGPAIESTSGVRGQPARWSGATNGFRVSVRDRKCRDVAALSSDAMNCRVCPLPLSSHNGALLKRCTPKRVPRVRIPASPVFSLGKLLNKESTRKCLLRDHSRRRQKIARNGARKKQLCVRTVSVVFDQSPSRGVTNPGVWVTLLKKTDTTLASLVAAFGICIDPGPAGPQKRTVILTDETL
jgi:hypothetical protein